VLYRDRCGLRHGMQDPSRCFLFQGGHHELRMGVLGRDRQLQLFGPDGRQRQGELFRAVRQPFRHGEKRERARHDHEIRRGAVFTRGRIQGLAPDGSHGASRSDVGKRDPRGTPRVERIPKSWRSARGLRAAFAWRHRRVPTMSRCSSLVPRRRAVSFNSSSLLRLVSLPVAFASQVGKSSRSTAGASFCDWAGTRSASSSRSGEAASKGKFSGIRDTRYSSSDG